jgi:DNA-binding IclR family transcriptional regulator
MPSISNALSILDLYNAQQPLWTAEEVIARLNFSQPTGYRYLRQLCAHGYLVRLPAGYVLGPKIVELDYHIRLSDPILRGARTIMRNLASQTGFDVLLMSTFGDQIITTHQEEGSETLEISFGRGSPMPLFRGAGSKAIVAFLPKAQQRRLHARNVEEASNAGLGRSFEEFEASMRAIRKARIAFSFGELNEGNVGIAAPIFQTSRMSCGSLTVVLSSRAYAGTDRDALVRAIKEAANRISVEVMQQSDAVEG